MGIGKKVLPNEIALCLRRKKNKQRSQKNCFLLPKIDGSPNAAKQCHTCNAKTVATTIHMFKCSKKRSHKLLTKLRRLCWWALHEFRGRLSMTTRFEVSGPGISQFTSAQFAFFQKFTNRPELTLICFRTDYHRFQILLASHENRKNAHCFFLTRLFFRNFQNYGVRQRPHQEASAPTRHVNTGTR
jgi:hypothetical protein